MHDAGLVGFLQAVANFAADFQDLLGRERTFENARGERFAFEKFHDEKVGAVLVADVVEVANVRMREGRDRAGFAIEAGLGVGIGGQVHRENFYGDAAVEAGVLGAIDFAHAAGAERAEDLVGTEFFAGREGHR